MSHVAHILTEWLGEQRHAPTGTTHCVSPFVDEVHGFTVHVWTALTDMQTAACIAVAVIRHVTVVSAPDFGRPQCLTVMGFAHTCLAAASVATILHQSMFAAEWSVRCIFVAPWPNHIQAMWCLIPSVVHTTTVVDDADPMCEVDTVSFDNSTEFIRLSSHRQTATATTTTSSPSASSMLLNICAIPRRSSSSSSGGIGTSLTITQRVERYVNQLHSVTPRDVWQHLDV